ncbi:hypothetical protein BG000_011507 [Podila horticola]|nr:hypothetical protein BG000_011507 [Podila horticola]
MKLAPLAAVLCLVAIARTAAAPGRSEDLKANSAESIANQGLRHHEIKGSESSRYHASGMIRRTDDKKEDKKGDKKGEKKEEKKDDKNTVDKSTGDDKNTVDKSTGDDKKNGTPAAPVSVPISGYSSPLWMVQPYSASVWEQGQVYVISWGPNPDPIHTKDLADHAPVDIRLMQGPPDLLKEVSVIEKASDSSTHSFTWTIPADLPPATDYTIRLSHEGSVDTYSHFFEVSKVGDPRSTKSNVGEPLVMPQLGAPIKQSPTPASKPATHVSSSVETKSANMLGFAMALFGAVYFL